MTRHRRATGRTDPTGSSRVLTRRLPAAWAQWLGGVPWRWLVTLTLDPKRPGPTGRAVSTSRDAIEREAKWWVGLVGRLSRSTVVWVMAPERQQSGNWHAHLVLDVVTDDAVRAATNDWEVRNGWCRVRRVDDPQGAVGYVVKGAVWVWTSDTLGPHVDKLRRDGGMRGRHP